MNKAKWTKGPWRLEHDGTIRAHAFGQSDQMGDYRGNTICDMKAGTGCDTWPAIGRRHAQPEAEANAHLIASAPELYEALEMYVQQEVDYMTINDLGDPEKQQSVQQGRKALAKARGETS